MKESSAHASIHHDSCQPLCYRKEIGLQSNSENGPKRILESAPAMTKREEKKKRQRLNQRIRNGLRSDYKKMVSRLEDGKYFQDENLKKEKQMLENLSYSMMYGLPGVFTIIIYSGSHQLRHKRDIVHIDCRVNLIIPENMCVIWHEGTLHSGAKT